MRAGILPQASYRETRELELFRKSRSMSFAALGRAVQDDNEFFGG
jgi:hypothetical protein